MAFFFKYNQIRCILFYFIIHFSFTIGNASGTETFVQTSASANELESTSYYDLFHTSSDAALSSLLNASTYMSIQESETDTHRTISETYNDLPNTTLFTISEDNQETTTTGVVITYTDIILSSSSNTIDSSSIETSNILNVETRGETLTTGTTSNNTTKSTNTTITDDEITSDGIPNPNNTIITEENNATIVENQSISYSVATTSADIRETSIQVSDATTNLSFFGSASSMVDLASTEIDNVSNAETRSDFHAVTTVNPFSSAPTSSDESTAENIFDASTQVEAFSSSSIVPILAISSSPLPEIIDTTNTSHAVTDVTASDFNVTSPSIGNQTDTSNVEFSMHNSDSETKTSTYSASTTVAATISPITSSSNVVQGFNDTSASSFLSGFVLSSSNHIVQATQGMPGRNESFAESTVSNTDIMDTSKNTTWTTSATSIMVINATAVNVGTAASTLSRMSETILGRSWVATTERKAPASSTASLRSSAQATAGGSPSPTPSQHNQTAVIAGLEEWGPVKILLPTITLEIPSPISETTFTLPSPFQQVQIQFPPGAWPLSRRAAGSGPTVTVFSLPASNPGSPWPGATCGPAVQLGPTGVELNSPIAVSLLCSVNESQTPNAFDYDDTSRLWGRLSYPPGQTYGGGVVWAQTQALTVLSGFVVAPAEDASGMSSLALIIGCVVGGSAVLGCAAALAWRRLRVRKTAPHFVLFKQAFSDDTEVVEIFV